MSDNTPRPDLEKLYRMRSATSRGGGGGRSSRSGGWGCPPAIAGVLGAPWLLDLLVAGSRPLT